MTDATDYRVSLDAYSGPLDLMLFLIRRDEIDIYDIPIARITKQFVDYLDVLTVIDPDSIGEFLVMAASLMEIKSRLLLPKPPPEEVETEFVDPRRELVQQLLEYKKFKDAARSLEDAAQVRSEKHAREPAITPQDPTELELENLDIWNLFEAFNKVLKQIGKAGTTYKIDVDDTPIALHAEDVLDSLERAGGTQRFEEVFLGRSRGEMIGLFLALLELIRQRRVRATQERPFSPILLEMLDRRPLDEIPDEEPDVAEAGLSLEAFDASIGSRKGDTSERADVGSSSVDHVALGDMEDESDLDMLDDLGDEFKLPEEVDVDAGVIAKKDADRKDIEYKPQRQGNVPPAPMGVETDTENQTDETK